MKKTCFFALAALLGILDTQAQCTYIASSQAVGNSSSVTLNKPSGVMPGDIMIAAIHVGWCNSGGNITAPAGWTLIAQTSNTGSGCGASNTTKQLATFYRIAGNSEPLAYVFTGSSNQYYVGGIVAYSGVNPSTPINASSNNGAQDACANIVANGVTTTAGNSRIVAVFFCSVNNSLNNIVPQNSLTERVDVGTTGNHPWGNENLEISDEVAVSTGPTGNRTAALSGCSSTGWVTGAQLIALQCGPATGLGELSPEGFTVNPNPSAGIFGISGEEEFAEGTELYVSDAFGRVIFRERVSGKEYALDIAGQKKGVYFLHVVSGGGVFRQRIVLQ